MLAHAARAPTHEANPEAILQSKFQVVSRHKRRTDIAFEVVFGPRPRRGLDHAAGSLRFAALARSNKQASKKKERNEEMDKREKTEKQEGCTEGGKRPPIILYVFIKANRKCANIAPTTKPSHRNDAGRVPMEARGVQRLKKRARTAPQGSQQGANDEPWPHRVAKREPKRKPNSFKRTTFEIFVLKA